MVKFFCFIFLKYSEVALTYLHSCVPYDVRIGARKALGLVQIWQKFLLANLDRFWVHPALHCMAWKTQLPGVILTKQTLVERGKKKRNSVFHYYQGLFRCWFFMKNTSVSNWELRICYVLYPLALQIIELGIWEKIPVILCGNAA